VIGSTRRVSVFAFAAPTDMRKSYDTLAALVTHTLGRDVLSGEMFVFVGKTRRRAKVLYWDGTGLCLFQKRLEQGRFAAPWRCTGDQALRWTMSELSLFLEGSELVGRMPLSPAPWNPATRPPRAA
jgi:transposase